MSEQKLIKMIEEMPLIIAKKEGGVVGFLLSASLKRNADIPIVKSMLNVYTGNNDAYLYGPVCVSIDERGKGLAGMMFDELRRQLPKRQGILFIRNDNDSSIEAHKKMGMVLCATFIHADVNFSVFTYFG
ncbi:GNAT family N-acetyltransferase [Erwinia sp. QL-Z3]|nr:GNAT family N-acetyltransferase [Erwinia sp. QL-Z3]